VLEVPSVVTDREWADEWADRLEDLLLEVGQVFPRADLRRRAAGCVRGLLGSLSRKNGWQLAEDAGDARPDGQQHLLDRSDRKMTGEWARDSVPAQRSGVGKWLWR
jgi:hypothetical protein